MQIQISKDTEFACLEPTTAPAYIVSLCWSTICRSTCLHLPRSSTYLQQHHLEEHLLNTARFGGALACILPLWA